jgi:hypothetical protein
MASFFGLAACFGPTAHACFPFVILKSCPARTAKVRGARKGTRHTTPTSSQCSCCPQYCLDLLLEIDGRRSLYLHAAERMGFLPRR